MLVQQKKVQAADWKIALIHYLIGGFAAPLILGTLSSRIIPSFFPQASSTFSMLPAALSTLFALVILFVCALYSAKYISGRYLIHKPSSVVRLAALYFIVGSLIPWIVGAILTGGMIFLAMSSFSSAQLFLVISSLILGLAIFYIASRMYITATPGQISPIVPPSPSRL